MGNVKTRQSRQSGSAFVISILVMFVLTVLGMALMLTTTTEVDIATNYRWGEMAFFHAEAGLEYAKNVLGEYRGRRKDGNLEYALPKARPKGKMANDPELGPLQTTASRDNQYSLPYPGDPSVRVVVGKVLFDRVKGRHLQYDYFNPTQGLGGGQISGIGGIGQQDDIQGTATIWVRRPIVPIPPSAGGGLQDNPLHDEVIITSEGTAPNYETAATGRPSATRRLEMSIRIVTEGQVDYYHSQAGGAGGTDTQASSEATSSSSSGLAVPK